MSSISTEFLITAFVVVLAPGTGVVFTVTMGVMAGARASVAAAFGCTLGIIPQMVASLLGLAALLHTSAIAFQTVKVLGVIYLLYLAWGLWRDNGFMALADPHDAAAKSTKRSPTSASLRGIALRAALINILNPKLSAFFLAFLPQFVPATAPDAVSRMGILGAVFMLMTFVVFVGYGVAANAIRSRLLASETATRWMQRLFAGVFAMFALKLAATER